MSNSNFDARCGYRRPGFFRTRNRDSRRAAVCVEMAFVAPVIFLLVFGAFEFARMMMVRQAFTNAARAGCRHACLVTTQDGKSVEQIVRQSLQGVIANADETQAIVVKMTPGFESSVSSGMTITTTVETGCGDVSWLPPFFLSGVTISGSATMTRE